MTENPTASEVQSRIRELLGRATLLRARGEQQEALKLTQEVLSLDEASWEACELTGDLLLDLGKGEEALEMYRRAKDLNASRGVLEEKIGRAALARAKTQASSDLSQALLEGRAQASLPPRKPGYAAILSLIVPGLGQLYNGEPVKGFVVMASFLLVFAMTGMALRGQLSASPLSPRGALYAPQVDVNSVLTGMFSGVTLIWVLLLAGVYIYAVADAGLRASRTMTSDDSGVV